MKFNHDFSLYHHVSAVECLFIDILFLSTSLVLAPNPTFCVPSQFVSWSVHPLEPPSETYVFALHDKWSTKARKLLMALSVNTYEKIFCFNTSIQFRIFYMYAQQMVVDTIRYSFSYAIKGTLSETSKRQYDDELSVEVGDCVTYCYSRYQKDNDDLWKK